MATMDKEFPTSPLDICTYSRFFQYNARYKCMGNAPATSLEKDEQCM